jgi:hypothetical protein
VLEAFPGLPKSPINPHGSSAASKSKGGTSAKASKSARQVPDFGAAYWNAASADQRLGFVLGYTTCKWSLRPDVEWSTNIREQLTSGYKSAPGSPEKLPAAIVRIARSKKHMT